MQTEYLDLMQPLDTGLRMRTSLATMPLRWGYSVRVGHHVLVYYGSGLCSYLRIIMALHRRITSP